MFFKTTLISLLALASTTLSLSITTPASESSYDISSSIPIIWSSVSTDPSSFSIQLVNFASYPTISQTLSSSVSTSDDKYTIAANSLTVTGVAFQINFVSTTPENSGILAQSGQFNLTKSSSSSSSSSSSASSSSSTTSSSSSTPTTTSSSSTTSGGFSFGNGTTTSTSTTSTTATGTSGGSTTGTSSSSATPSSFTGAANKFGSTEAVKVVFGAAGAFMAAMML